MSPSQKASEQMAMQSPLTLVGKISAHRMLGMGPNPMTKQHRYTTTLPVATAACAAAAIGTTLAATSTTSDATSTGMVHSSSARRPDTSMRRMATPMVGSISSVVRPLMRMEVESALRPRLASRTLTPAWLRICGDLHRDAAHQRVANAGLQELAPPPLLLLRHRRRVLQRRPIGLRLAAVQVQRRLAHQRRRVHHALAAAARLLVQVHPLHHAALRAVRVLPGQLPPAADAHRGGRLVPARRGHAAQPAPVQQRGAEMIAVLI
nr:unnamed protein product [Digitaria exilis]